MATKKTLLKLAKIATNTTTGVALSSSELLAGSVFVQAKKVGGVNTGIVYLSTDTTTNQYVTLATNGTWSMTLGAGDALDLSSVYLRVATANDGVVVVYTSDSAG